MPIIPLLSLIFTAIKLVLELSNYLRTNGGLSKTAQEALNEAHKALEAASGYVATARDNHVEAP